MPQKTKTEDIAALAVNLTAPEFTKGEVKFVIGKLAPMEAYHFIDKIRNMVGGATDTSTITKDSWAAFLAGAILKLPHNDLEFIRKQLFEHIEFTAPDAPGLRPLAGSEDIAFKDLDAGIVYEMIVRAFSVNFTDILVRIQSVLGEEEEETSKPSPPKRFRASSRPR